MGGQLRGSFRTAVAEPAKRIPVVVHAPDPISREGTISQLRQHPVIDLVDEADAQGGGVAVLLTETLDETMFSWLRRLVRSDGLHAVLVVSLIREAELLDIIECGVGAIVWRREATGQRLLQAVLAAHRGDGDLPSDLLGRLISQVGSLRPGTVGAPGGRPSGLNQREVDALRLVAEGMDTGEIARKLAYSERTVKNIMQGLTTRLNLRNRAHAVAYALREGYIS
ncbi:helix-turn-helix transcriptional regulator [Streptomyces pinistramenti]|uniref:helix-turn-helix transcriptional regulator n=1 Tax=Streptomyces pinistramenti TaxID=2884812 RepID=UPI001D07A435|nr:response regulator transcription factor [Streptomyces pinistramenti]MCB5909133.1 response regulator transcription factor [Streptomyces pinistramenti]